MEFDKTRVYTAVNADEVLPGSKVVVGNTLSELIYAVMDNNIVTLKGVRGNSNVYRFLIEENNISYNLCYLISSPEEQYLRW